MASLKDTDGTEQESDKKKEKGTLESAEENLASIRSTLAALDGLNKRWEVIIGSCRWGRGCTSSA